MGQKKWIHIFSKRKRELHELYWNSNLTCWFLVPNRLPLLHLHIHYWVLIYLILSFSLLFLFVFFKASIFFILKKKFLNFFCLQNWSPLPYWFWPCSGYEHQERWGCFHERYSGWSSEHYVAEEKRNQKWVELFAFSLLNKKLLIVYV